MKTSKVENVSDIMLIEKEGHDKFYSVIMSILKSYVNMDNI